MVMSDNDFVAQLGAFRHTPDDPDPYWALYVDTGLPLDPQTKAALTLDGHSFSRRYLLPIIRPMARIAMFMVGLFRTFVPKAWASSRRLHWLIYWGLKHFVSPQANFLILRHFHLGSNIVRFFGGQCRGLRQHQSPATKGPC